MDNLIITRLLIMGRDIVRLHTLIEYSLPFLKAILTVILPLP